MKEQRFLRQREFVLQMVRERIWRTLFLVFILPVVLALGGLALAAGSDYTVDFSAAHPASYGKVFPATLSYPRPEGGTAADPLDAPSGEGTDDATFGDPKVSVQSLAPERLALGQIVAFEVKVDAHGSTEPEGGVIKFTAGWNTETTSGDRFGYDSSCGAFYAFVDTSDPANKNLDGDETVSSFSWVTTSDEIQGTFTVEGLDDGDEVVIEIWVVLDDTIAPGTSGDVPSRLISAQTASGSSISTGTQSVLLERVNEFFTVDADLSVSKSDFFDPVYIGERLSYDVIVSNLSTDTVANGVIMADTIDPNTSFVSIAVSRVDSGAKPIRTLFACRESGGTVTCDLGPLIPGEVVRNTITVEVLATAPATETGGEGPCNGLEDLGNEVIVSSIGEDQNMQNNSDCEPTGVLPLVSAVDIETIAEPAVIPAGGTVLYSYTVTNVGDVVLSNVSVSDNTWSPVTFTGGDTNGDGLLDLDESWTYNRSVSPTQSTLSTATVTADNPAARPVSDSATAFVEVVQP